MSPKRQRPKPIAEPGSLYALATEEERELIHRGSIEADKVLSAMEIWEEAGFVSVPGRNISLEA